MNNKLEKWTALLVVLTFVWLLQVSTMPVTAAGFAEQASITGSEQGPGFYEAIAQEAAPTKKKSILPYVLIGVGVLAVIAAVYFLVLKSSESSESSYDITGTWDFTFTRGSDTESRIIIFTGNKDSGTYVSNIDESFTGTYTVVDKNVTMTVKNWPSIPFNGQFTGKDAMSGTYNLGSEIWNWTATRNSAAASLPPTPAGQTKLLPK